MAFHVKNQRMVRTMTTVVVFYIAAIAAAEVVGVFVGVLLSIGLHAQLVLALLSSYMLMSETFGRRILPVLALAPLLRILSLTMPTPEVPQIFWHAMIGGPLLVAVALTARLLERSWTDVGLRLRMWPVQLSIALSGLPLSLWGFLFLRPKPLVATFDWRAVAIGSIILVVFSAFTEEVIFRGLLQQVASELFGRAGLLCSTALFAAMYIGSLSPSYTLFMTLVGLIFGWCVRWTGSIWGVVLAHGLLNIGMALIWPFLFPGMVAGSL